VNDNAALKEKFNDLADESKTPIEVKQLEDALNSVIEERAEAERERQRTARNPELRARCVDMTEQIKSLTNQINALAEYVLPLEHARQEAQHALSEFVESQPNGPYVSRESVDSHAERQKELERKLEKACVAIRDRNRQHAELMRRLLAIDGEFQKLSFQERLSRPRQPEDPSHSDGQLLAVR